jgi:hypothetical protein
VIEHGEYYNVAFTDGVFGSGGIASIKIEPTPIMIQLRAKAAELRRLADQASQEAFEIGQKLAQEKFSLPGMKTK